MFLFRNILYSSNSQSFSFKISLPLRLPAYMIVATAHTKSLSSFLIFEFLKVSLGWCEVHPDSKHWLLDPVGSHLVISKCFPIQFNLTSSSSGASIHFRSIFSLDPPLRNYIFPPDLHVDLDLKMT